MLVETVHTTRNIRYKFHGFGRSPNQLAFPLGENSEPTSDATLTLQEITVEKYFEQKYNIKLKYPHLPCIDARSGPAQRANYLPMEVVKVSFFSSNVSIDNDGESICRLSNGNEH